MRKKEVATGKLTSRFDFPCDVKQASDISLENTILHMFKSDLSIDNMSLLTQYILCNVIVFLQIPRCI